MASASTFSYAQAAKGQGAPVTQTPQPNTTCPENEVAASSADQTSATPVTNTQVTDQAPATESSPAVPEKQDVETSSAVGSDTRAESVQERRTETRREDDSGRLDRPWRRNDKGTRSSSATTRSVDDHSEARRSRKGKKGKSSDKQTADPTTQDEQEPKEEEAPKISLVEASVPSVNIWQQRKEAAAAKKPEESTGAQATPAANAADAAAPVREAVVNGTKPNHKAGEAAKSDRTGSRGSRMAAKDVRNELPPPVQDASLWPTPDTALSQDKKPLAEKTPLSPKEKEVQDEGKPRQKKEWVTYDYVPTVSFETQIPSMRGSKPRGGAKGANGTRTAAGTQSGEKSTSTTTPAKAAEPKARDATNSANGVTPPSSTTKPASAETPREQKRSTPTANAEKTKETNVGHHSDHPTATREGRSERTRGAYRGRGSHHGSNSHAHHQHSHSASMNAASFANQAPMNPRQHGTFSPPPRQGGQGQMFAGQTSRGRGGRNAGNFHHRMSLPNGSSRIPPVQTTFAPYDYTAVAPMTAVPFQQPPMWDNMIIGMLRSQIEYYFSIENLCKDMYLRQRMDSQGFVPLMFITAFKRMRELSPDTALIRTVCEESNEIDYVVGEDDGIERLRRRHNWSHFILPEEERDESARNEGPKQVIFKSRAFAPFGQQFSSINQYIPAAPFVPQGGAPYTAEGVNGFVNGNTNDYGVHSQLSANVPDFSPSHPVGKQTGLEAATEALNVNGVAPAVNGLPNGVHNEE